MFLETDSNLKGRVKSALLGRARNPLDPHVFHKLSLIAFFAWVGLGADGLSSSSYGPEEAYKVLVGHENLSIFIAIASAITIFVISRSYVEIIELFPSGGGGYVVASKLLSPYAGMVSGAALIIDYVLTITVSVASGVDALLSFLPAGYQQYKLIGSVLGVCLLIVLNLRGVKESVSVLVPIFILFVATHAFAILYALVSHALDLPAVTHRVTTDLTQSMTQLGGWGVLFLMLRAYSMGAGTYTGIEAVSNGMAILREPRVATGKRTMLYMAASLSVTVVGLFLAYLLYKVAPGTEKTLNAVLFERMSENWNPSVASTFVIVILFSEAALLFVAAQTGFLDGPRVMSNMALDRWLPRKFFLLSDRLVTKNGILVMGLSAIVMMLVTNASVTFLVVMYSINVFLTFMLSQLGMVRHWWLVRQEQPNWEKKLVVNGFGLCLTVVIFISVVILKFNEGGWMTVLFTGSFIAFVIMVRRKYSKTQQLLSRLKDLETMLQEELDSKSSIAIQPPPMNTKAKTAVLLVNGYNGYGLHTLFTSLRTFGKTFENYVFVEVGALDAGTFKGTKEIANLEHQVEEDLKKYTRYMRHQGYNTDAFHSLGVDVIEEISKLADQVLRKYPNSVFFTSQLVFAEETFFTRLLHSFTAFAIQRSLYHKGASVVVLPIRV
ncbi:MAG: APC family permease [bacterium]